MASILTRLAGYAVLSLLIALAPGARTQVPMELQSRFMNLSAAAVRGDPEAYFPLAQMYADGQGTPRNLIEAYALAEIAGIILNLPEDSDQERALALKQQLTTQLTPQQIELAHRRAHERPPDLEQIQRQPMAALKALLALLGSAVLLGIALRLLIQRAVFRHKVAHFIKALPRNSRTMTPNFPRQELRYSMPKGAPYESWEFVRWDGDDRIRLKVSVSLPGQRQMIDFETDAVLTDKGWTLNRPELRP